MNVSTRTHFDEVQSRPHSSAPAGAGRGAWTAVAILTVLAIVLRAIHLNGELWLDEMYASILSFRRSLVDLLTVYEGDNQHPLYSLLAHLGIVLFGESPASIRLPAMLFGVASVPVLFLLGTRVASRLEGVLAAALLTFSYHHVWFSQNARGYTMLAFWAMLATYCILRGIEDRSRRFMAGYAAAVALGIYTHLTMIFMVAAHGLICVWLVAFARAGRRLDWKLVVLAFGLGGVLTLALYAPLIGEVLDFFRNRPSRLLGVSTPAWALAEALRILRVGMGAGWTLVAGGIVFGIGVISYARRHPLALALFVLPGMTTIAGALLGRGTMYPRFFFFLIGFALLIVVRGAFAIGELSAQFVRRNSPSYPVGTSVGSALIGCVLISFALSLRYNYALPKQAFQQAAAYVEANAQPGDPVGVANATWYAYIEYYGKPWTRLTYRDDPTDNPAANLARLRSTGTTTWLVYTFPRYLEHEAPALSETIRSECGSAQKFDSSVGDGDVFVCALPALD